MSATAIACLLTLSFQTKFQMPLQISIRSDTPLVPMFHQDRAYLVYELELVNYNAGPADLTKIAVTDAKGQVISTFAGDALKKCLSPERGEPGADPTTLEPGKLVLAYMWLDVAPNAVPEKIGHTLTFKRADAGPPTVSGGRLQLSAKRGITIRPPLEGSNWIAGNGPSNTSGHRRARLCLGGHASIGQRFAIDWLQVDSKGMTFSGPEDKNESYYAYNENVLACADAKVAKVVDGVKPNVPHGNALAEVITPRTLPGNHIILDLGHGIYAAYAHLIPGSIRVKAGQRVKSGQILGKLGNTGNSSEPHLHFQIMNAPDFIMSEGLPFGHPLLNIQKTAPVPGNEFAVKLVGPRIQIKNQMPLENDWVSFPK